MGNPQHLEWLLEGVMAWNARRERTPFTPDLSGMDVRGAFEKAGKLNPEGRVDLKRIDFTSAILSLSSFQGALLNSATITDAALDETVLDGADLRQAILSESTLQNAKLRGVNFRGAIMDRVNVSSIDAYGKKNTDLSVALRIDQDQLNSMFGDSTTLIPEGLTRPAHWPVLAMGQQENGPEDPSADKLSLLPEASDDTPPSLPATVDRLSPVIRSRSPAELRAALQQSYTEPASLAAYMVAQLQREIAAQEMTAIPNHEPELSQYYARLNFLKEMQVAVQVIHEHLPVNVPAAVTEADAATIKEKLLALAGQIQTALQWLDEDTGTVGNMWKIGVITLATALMSAAGFSATIGLPVAAGVVGVNTFRVIVQRKA